MSDRRLRVLVLAVCSSFHTERFVAELRRQNCRVLLASLEPGRLHHFHLKRIGPHRLFHYTLAALQVRRLVARFKPHVVNPHYAAGYGYTVALANIYKSHSVVLNLWGGDILLAPNKTAPQRFKPVLALKRSDCVIGDSQYIVDEAAKLTPLWSVRVIPWGIERRYLSLHKKSYNYGRPVKVIVPRRLEPLYNHEFIVRSLSPLMVNGTIELTLPRFGEQATTLVRVLKQKVSTGLRFYDPLPREQFLRLMSGCDVYLSAASVDSSPVTLIEAMALGLVPVVADVPGVREWLTPQNGFLFELGNEVMLRDVISRILDRRDLSADMRRENQKRVEREAIFECNVAEQISIMQRLAQERRS